MRPNLRLPRRRVQMMLGVAAIALTATSCGVVHFNYGTVDPMPPWDADAAVKMYLGPGSHIVNGVVYDGHGRPYICNVTDPSGAFVANGRSFDPHGNLYCQ